MSLQDVRISCSPCAFPALPPASRVSREPGAFQVENYIWGQELGLGVVLVTRVTVCRPLFVGGVIEPPHIRACARAHPTLPAFVGLYCKP